MLRTERTRSFRQLTEDVLAALRESDSLRADLERVVDHLLQE